MHISDFLVMKEEDEVSFIYMGEWGVEKSSYPKRVTHGEVHTIMSFLTYDEPMVMGDGSLSLKSDIHRVSGINYAKSSAKFTIEYIQVDFFNNHVDMINKWEFDVKQYPDGYVKHKSIYKE